MNKMNDSGALRERLSWLVRDAEHTDSEEGDSTFIPVSLAGFKDTVTQAIRALSPQGSEPAGVGDDSIKSMVNRFLCWPMPRDFSPDCGVTFTPIPNPHCWPTGTNLLTADQAKAMFEYCTAGTDDLAQMAVDAGPLAAASILAEQLAAPVPAQQAVTLEWAVSRWRDEVSNRPLVNKHRRSLDDAWRQVIRRLGADDVVICGPRHDELLAANTTAQGASDA